MSVHPQRGQASPGSRTPDRRRREGRRSRREGRAGRESVVPRPLTRGSGGRERKEKRLEEPRRSSRSSARTRGARREEARGAAPRRPHGARRRRRRGARGEPRRQRCSASVRGAEEIIIVSQSGRGGARQHKHHTALRRTREETTRGTAGGPFISPNARSDERMEREERLAELGASNGNPKDSERDRPYRSRYRRGAPQLCCAKI